MSQQSILTLRQIRVPARAPFDSKDLVNPFCTGRDDRSGETQEIEPLDRQIAALLQAINFGEPPAEIWEQIRQRADQFQPEFV